MYKILLVDDDPSLLVAMSQALMQSGFDVIEASDGQQAMELLRDHTVGLTIVDISMPIVDGIEFMIRVKWLLPEVSFVAMYGRGTVDKSSVLESRQSAIGKAPGGEVG